jgi:aspartyl protease family protein
MDQEAKTKIEIEHLDFTHRSKSERRDYVIPIMAAAAFLVLLTGSIGGYYYYKTSERFNPYAGLYSRLGINVSRTFESVRGALPLLSRLDSDPCDAKTLLDFSKLLSDVRLSREAAVSIASYNYNCPYSREMIDKAVTSFDNLGDFAAGIRLAETMLKNDPTNSHGYFLRGSANEKARNYQAALPNYLTALEIIALPSRVAYSQFYRVSHMYELTERFCDAVSIEDTYVYFNPKFSEDNFVKKRISDLWRRGNCSSNYALGTASVTIPSDGILTVEVNGIPARMRIDLQNVSTVLTQEFADRARIKPDMSPLITPNTPTQKLVFASADAQTLKIDTSLATLVPVRVALGVASPFGAGIDGQLGTSFLNRYDFKLSQSLDLKQRVRN